MPEPSGHLWTAMHPKKRGWHASVKGIQSGDQAPDLSGVQWISGKPLEPWKPGHVYLLYFWNSSRETFSRVKSDLEALRKLNSVFRSQNVHLAALNLDESEDQRSRLLLEASHSALEVGTGIDPGHTLRDPWRPFGDWQLPMFCVVDGNGRIGFLEKGHYFPWVMGVERKVTQEISLAAELAGGPTLEELERGFQESLERKEWESARRALESLKGLGGKGMKTIYKSGGMQVRVSSEFNLPFMEVQLPTREGDFAKAREAALKASQSLDPCKLTSIALALIDSEAPLPKETVDLAHTLALKGNHAPHQRECELGKAEHLSALAQTASRRGEHARARQLLEQAKTMTEQELNAALESEDPRPLRSMLNSRQARGNWGGKDRSETLDFLDIIVSSKEGHIPERRDFALRKVRDLALRLSQITTDRCILGGLTKCLLLSSKAPLPEETVSLAHTLALKACENHPNSEHQADHLRTLACTIFLRGELTKAFEILKQAKTMTQNPEMLKTLEETAEAFHQGNLPLKLGPRFRSGNFE
jgi:tetratricopeptide (TPR) repeat protein